MSSGDTRNEVLGTAAISLVKVHEGFSKQVKQKEFLKVYFIETGIVWIYYLGIKLIL